MNNNDITVKEYASLKVINLQYDNSADEQDTFLFVAAKVLSEKGFEIIKKCYEDSKLIFPLFHDNDNISFNSADNIMLPYVKIFIRQLFMFHCKM